MCAELDFVGLENNEQDLYQEDQPEDDDLDFAMF